MGVFGWEYFRGCYGHPIVKDSVKPFLTLGRNIARLRSACGLTQERLAEMADIHPRYLQKLESGVTNPSFMVLCRLKTALDCEWNVLLHNLP
jgi:transcriptional regulator with XRE-family HTH domain